MIILLKTALIFFVKKELDCMKFNRISAIAVTAFAVTLPFSLLACSESNPTNADDPIAYSEPAPGPSSALETSSSVTEVSSEVSSSSGEPSGTGCQAMVYTVNDECLPACNDENEGKVETVWVGNPKYGYETFHKCQNGSWVQGDISLTCDTAGVQVGDLCYRTGSTNIFLAGMNVTPSERTFAYAGNGVWEECDGLTKITRECTAENIGDKEKIVYGHDDNTLSMYYKCFDDGWTRIDESTFYCADSVSVSGTCSIEIDGKMVYYKYDDGAILVNGVWMNGGWVKSGYDPELGFCPVIYKTYFVSCGEGSEFNCEVDEYNQPKLRESGWVNYYCRAGQWKQSNLVPNQYTDSRKEGLTDMEYDVLDLPKEAKVGDRVGGLLETCWYDEELYTIGGWGVYDYCLSRNYYRYRENGSWTLETRSEFEDYLSSDHLGCNAETEGEKRYSLPRNDKPGAVYQCVSGYAEPVEYIFNRYEKAGE